MRNLLRSTNPKVRIRAAEDYLARSQDHLKALETKLAETTIPEERRSLRNRLDATRAYLSSWEDYILAGCPPEPRAQITPTIHRALLKV